jgi:succinate-semialdehyde dehydrogenase/glutarate-semialdehyde dehydrogenase
LFKKDPMSIQSINPVNGEIIQRYTATSETEVNSKIDQAHEAWKSWRRVPLHQKADLLMKAAAILRTRKDALAMVMALEMGKPLKDGLGEVEKCAAVCEYYAQHGQEYLSDELVSTEASKSYIAYQPIGIVLAVMPWNFPFWQVFRFLAPGLMAGNCGLLKHASNVPGCALAIEEVLLEAGFPEHVFQTLLIDSKATRKVIEHPLVRAVTLTGSTEAGMQVAQQAAGLLKKSVLELGGSDAYLVLEDADLEAAAETCVQSRLINNGQSCIAAKRFILLEGIADEFTEIFKAKMASRITGDPLQEGTQLGPMARKDLRDELHQDVQKNIQAGAKCILGGKIPDISGNHAFYTPTILTGIKKGMPAYEEETFGPVASMITATNMEEAIYIANDTKFGLGAAVFSRNIARAEQIAREELQAGSCFVNSLVKSDPRLPFGGIKGSGYGRELGLVGMHEFVNIKTVYLA